MPTTLLAYIADDGSLCLRSIPAAPADWGVPTRLADSVADALRYHWPCWSPDGQRLLVSAAGHDAGGQPRLEVWQYAANGGGAGQRLFANAPDGAAFIAPNVPHYVSWSPDGGRVAVAAQGQNGLDLFIVDAQGKQAPRLVAAGAPLYLDWAPDGRRLAVHAGADLSIVDLHEEIEAGVLRLLSDVPTFRAPAWTVDGAAVIYAAPRASGVNALWRAQRDGSDRAPILDLDGLCVFTRAPHHDVLALMTLVAGGPTGHRLRLLHLPSQETDAVHAGPVAAAFWSPSGARLFYLTPHSTDGDLLLSAYDVPSRRQRRLAGFRAGAEFATLLAFHDQYARSHALVSPDGHWFAFAGVAHGNGGAGRQGFQPQTGCYLVPSDGSGPAQRAAAGDIAFFPPRTPLPPA